MRTNSFFVMTLLLGAGFTQAKAENSKVFQESNGLCVIEAEHGVASQNGDETNWTIKTDATAGGGQCMTPAKAGAVKIGAWNNACDLSFLVGIQTPGNYYLAARHIADKEANSAQVGVDGVRTEPWSFEEIVSEWKWRRCATPFFLKAGVHTIAVRRREAGWKVDRVAIARESENLPSGTDMGPAENASRPATAGDLKEAAQAYFEEPIHLAKLAALKAAHTGWTMHNIDNTLWNHNSLSPGDVNRDGFTDYAVIHEGVEKFTFVLHPGPGGDIRKPWQKVILGEGPNPEYSDFGDFDGDGNLDIVGACGHSPTASTGINIFWGPETKRVSDGASWVDAGLIPGTKDRGHFLYVRSRDVNGDGAMDIVAGGRVLGTHSLENMAGKKTAGIVWIEAPADRGARRDLSKWTVHDIDPLTAGGHGFVFVDIDGDGDEDIANSNADWNTKPSDEMVLWYENPGAGSAQQKAPWPAHVIYRGSEIYSKGQVAAGDIDGDGLPDLCVQTEKSVFYFRQTGRNPVTWERIVIPKRDMTQWLARPTKLADINGDGRLDIVGMLIHDEKGNLPVDKASVFWMEWRGEKPRADNWITHVVKWSDGVNTGEKYRGEKWDHCRFTDMDGDGDMDIVGNCEEHYTGERGNKTTVVGVVWFENPQ